MEQRIKIDNNNNSNKIFIQRVLMFSHPFVPKNFIFLLHSYRSIYLILLIPFSLISVVTSYIHEFRGLLFILPKGGHHSHVFPGSLSSFILCMWLYQFNCLYLMQYKT